MMGDDNTIGYSTIVNCDRIIWSMYKWHYLCIFAIALFALLFMWIMYLASILYVVCYYRDLKFE